jgi:hypothetical protein
MPRAVFEEALRGDVRSPCAAHGRFRSVPMADVELLTPPCGESHALVLVEGRARPRWRGLLCRATAGHRWHLRDRARRELAQRSP